MELRDKNGLTEAEFLSTYRQKDYPKPSLTADLMLLRQTEVLLIRRGGHPYLGCWALPGGFVEPGEAAEAAAARELEEETHLSGLACCPLGLYSDPGRDPRGWVVSAAYLAVTDAPLQAVAGDDAREAAWFAITAETLGTAQLLLTLSHGTDTIRVKSQRIRTPISGIETAKVLESQGLAFDHGKIISDGWLLAASRRS